MRGGIAIAGRAGSGKSHLAREVVVELQERGFRAQIVSFATELKLEVWEQYGLKKGDLGSREALIAHGEARNWERPGYWVDKLAPVVRALWADDVVPVCDDLRRLHEFEWLKAEGFYAVRVAAPEERRRARLQEQGLDPDFALSSDPTEADHERWLFDASLHNLSPRGLRDGAARTVARALERAYIARDAPAAA